ncbi:ABC transporter permease [bacterium]|nr:ABC transporter permease [bacterium]
MRLWQNIQIALNAIGGNLTRTIITCLIISIGIMALVGILTAIDGIESSLSKNFSFMGANSFNIQNRSSGFSLGRNSKRVFHENISYKEAMEFKERFDMDAAVSVISNNTWVAVAKAGSEKTNPNTGVVGSDANYMRASGYSLEEGRNLNPADIEKGNNVVIIGQEIKTKLFGNRSPLNKDISIGGVKLRVIGVFDKKGGAFDFGGDRVAVVPVSLARAQFPRSNMSYTIAVAVEDVMMLEPAIDYSTSLFRQVRKLRIKEEENFSIVKSDSITQVAMESLQMVIIAAILIATITLLGAAIALMNIMLVSVTERTKEIGTRKAIGAKSSTVLNQFVIEAITICQIGGLGGVILGIIVGNITSNAIGGSFIIPWNWVILALVVCTIVGLSAGIWPAYKASKIDPIEALRHE